MEYPFAQLGLPVQAVSPPNLPCSSNFLAVEEAEKALALCTSCSTVTKTSLYYHSDNIEFSTNPEDSPIPVPVKKMNSTQAKIRTHCVTEIFPYPVMATPFKLIMLKKAVAFVWIFLLL